jgi:hypothetical protein
MELPQTNNEYRRSETGDLERIREVHIYLMTAAALAELAPSAHYDPASGLHRQIPFTD